MSGVNRVSFDQGTFHISTYSEKVTVKDLFEVLKGLDYSTVIKQSKMNNPAAFFKSINSYKITQLDSQGGVTKTIVISQKKSATGVEEHEKTGPEKDAKINASDEVVEGLDFDAVHLMVVEIATPIILKNEPVSTRNDRRSDKSTSKATTYKNDAIAAAKKKQKMEQELLVKKEEGTETSVERLQEKGNRQERDLREANKEKVEKADSKKQAEREVKHNKEERGNG